MGWSWFEPVVRDNSLARAAQLLDISEYDFFALAYWHQFGQIAQREHLDRLFGIYIRDQDTIPPWARDFAHEIVTKADADTLDPKDYGVRSPVPKLHDLFHMLRDVALVLIFMSLFAFGLWLSHEAA